MRSPPPIPVEGTSVATDYSRWRLQDRTDDGGRHIWDYVDEETAKREPQSLASKYWLGMDLVITSVSCFARDVHAEDAGPSTITQSQDSYGGSEEWVYFLQKNPNGRRALG